MNDDESQIQHHLAFLHPSSLTNNQGVDVLIEQAIFTSARTGQHDGYHLVAVSPGVPSDDARELVRWGPTHDSLLNSALGKGSINFHRLSDSLMCMSRTTASGAEHSGRKGPRIYTQCLIVTSDVMARFAYNPFRVLEAATAAGRMTVLDSIPKHISPFQLSGRSSIVDSELLQRLIRDPGPAKLTAILDAVITKPTVGLLSVMRAEMIYDGLINLLPPACRGELCFSTGLKFSPRRPYRLISLPRDPAQIRHARRQTELTVIDLDVEHSRKIVPHDGWAALVYLLLEDGRIHDLSVLLNQRRDQVKLEELDELADRWKASHDVRPSARQHPWKEQTAEEVAPLTAAAGNRNNPAPDPTLPRMQHAHEPHRQFAKSAASPVETETETDRPIHKLEGKLDLACGWLMDKLQELDDAVFDAIDGKADALVRVRQLWPEVLSKLDPRHIEESRDEYLRYALSTWLKKTRADGTRDAELAMSALDALCVLFEEV